MWLFYWWSSVILQINNTCQSDLCIVTIGSDKNALTMWWSLWVIFVVMVMVFNATFNNISVLSWRSVLLVKETRVPGKNHRPVASHWQTVSHNIVPRLSGVRTHNVSGDRHWLEFVATTSQQFNCSKYCSWIWLDP
jgi:hypothetical protein